MFKTLIAFVANWLKIPEFNMLIMSSDRFGSGNYNNSTIRNVSCDWLKRAGFFRLFLVADEIEEPGVIGYGDM